MVLVPIMNSSANFKPRQSEDCGWHNLYIHPYSTAVTISSIPKDVVSVIEVSESMKANNFSLPKRLESPSLKHSLFLIELLLWHVTRRQNCHQRRHLKISSKMSHSDQSNSDGLERWQWLGNNLQVKKLLDGLPKYTKVNHVIKDRDVRVECTTKSRYVNIS